MGVFFNFTDKMVQEATILAIEEARRIDPRKKISSNPRPKDLDNEFELQAWDFWYNLCSFMLKVLRERQPLLTGNSKNEDCSSLFEFRFENGNFILLINEGWAAEALSLPQEFIAQEKNLLSVYLEIIEIIKRRQINH